MQTNEFRVRPVTRFQITHHQRDDDDAKTAMTRTVGEFPSVEAAEEVGVALQALVPWSTLETIEGRQAAYPPKALAAAMAVREETKARAVRVGDTIPVIVTNEGDVQNMRVTSITEHALSRIFDCSFPEGMFLNGRGTGRVIDQQPWKLAVENGGIQAD